MSTAVLLSGGLDSAVLVADEAAAGEVQPDLRQRRARVGSGRARDGVALPRRHATLARPRAPAGLARRRHARRLRRDALGDAGTAARHITRRTRTCICRGATWCCSARRRSTARRRRSSAWSSARSRTIRFPTRRRRSATAMARALSLGLDRPLQIEAPYADTEKAEVIRRGAALGVPFELTLSCMNPPKRSALSRQPSAIHPWPSTAANAASAASAMTPLSRPASPIPPATPAQPISADIR